MNETKRENETRVADEDLIYSLQVDVDFHARFFSS